jgi:hypothetical protein
MKKTILRFALIVSAVNVIIISAGWAATINSDSCSQPDVQAAITAASTGDTVIIPNGSCTWTTSVTLAKSIILKGAGADKTRITLNGSGSAMSVGAGTWRITGIGFIIEPPSSGVMDGQMLNGWRIDHCTFTSSGAYATKNSIIIVGYHDGPNRRGFGLFDNNTLTNVWAPLFYGGVCNYSNEEWANSLGLGTADALFIENNTFINTIGSNILTQPDGNCGSRVVFRYNDIESFNSAMHSVQGGHRAARMWEIYGNVYTSNAFPTWIVAHLRGGTGVAYNNTIGNGFSNMGFALDNVRSCEARDPVGTCNGLSSYDGNRTGGHGYPCRDQIGRSTDAYQMSDGNFPAQSLSPAYFWNNKNGTNEVPAEARKTCTNQYTYHILEDRDFYNYKTSFNGTTGVGSGLLANRPASCTTNESEAGGGVAYWATDTNTLYRCSAKNTWGVHYKPYIYPHPLTRPEPPQSLRIRK